jgi:hypothetical protein
MRRKPTSTDTQTYGTVETRQNRTATSSTARLYPDAVARIATEHRAFVDPTQLPGFVDQHGTTWFTYPATWPPCTCGLPVRENRLTCGSRLCTGAL